MAEITSKPKSQLMAALIEAQSKVEAVAKDSRNDFHKYDYASAESVLTGARKALDECGLAVFQAGWKFTEIGREIIRPADGKETIDVPSLGAEITYELHHAESGESGVYQTVVPIREEKGRPLDKALFGALTEGLAYFLRGLLLIPRADAETPSARNDTAYQPPDKTESKTSKPAKPAPVSPARAFAEAVEKLFPGQSPEDIQRLITAAGKAVMGDSFDGKWKELDGKTLDRMLKALRESKEAAS